MWKQTGCIFNPAEIPSVLKEGQSLANISPGTCLRASFYARAPLAASFTPYSIRSLTRTESVVFDSIQLFYIKADGLVIQRINIIALTKLEI